MVTGHPTLLSFGLFSYSYLSHLVWLVDDTGSNDGIWVAKLLPKESQTLRQQCPFWKASNKALSRISTNIFKKTNISKHPFWKAHLFSVSFSPSQATAGNHRPRHIHRRSRCCWWGQSRRCLVMTVHCKGVLQILDGSQTRWLFKCVFLILANLGRSAPIKTYTLHACQYIGICFVNLLCWAQMPWPQHPQLIQPADPKLRVQARLSSIDPRNVVGFLNILIIH